MYNSTKMSAPNNIYGGGGRRSAMASVDFYRRVPKDLTEVRFIKHYTCRSIYDVVVVILQYISCVMWFGLIRRAVLRGVVHMNVI